MNYRTPGVYIEEIRKFPPSVAQVETAIPAFIGYTEFARKDGIDLHAPGAPVTPVRVSSLLEYSEIFGGPEREQGLVVTFDQDLDSRGNVLKESVTADFDIPNGRVPSRHLLYHSLEVYFANGGGPCWIVSIGPYTATQFGAELTDATPFTNGLTAIQQEDEPTLIVIPEAQGMDRGTYVAVYGAAIMQCQNLKDRFTIIDFHHTGVGLTNPNLPNAMNEFRGRVPGGSISDIELAKYAASYFPNIRSTFNYQFDMPNVQIRHIFRGGQPTENHDGKAMDALPNAFRSRAQAAIDRFSIFLPPSGAIAGVYARVDNTRGVWKAPANEAVLAVDDLTFRVTDENQRDLNVDVANGKSVNCLRSFVGAGIKVWGARTLAGNDNEWRYVSVRRFFNMVEESVKKATNSFVFEPNDRNTWSQVRAMIENFLVLQWRAGALAGPVPEKAFYVRVGLGETMTAVDILEGRMIVEIGMAVVRPAEFIILKFSHKMQEA